MPPQDSTMDARVTRVETLLEDLPKLLDAQSATIKTELKSVDDHLGRVHDTVNAINSVCPKHGAVLADHEARITALEGNVKSLWVRMWTAVGLVLAGTIALFYEGIKNWLHGGAAGK